MKNRGKNIFILLILIFTIIPDYIYSSEIKTILEDSKIEIGETTTIKFKISGKSSNIEPLKIPAINGLKINFSGTMSSFQFINGKTWRGLVFTYSITAFKKGRYKIPSFIFDADGKKLISKPVSLIVIKGIRSINKNLRVEQDESDIRIIKPLLEFSKNKAYSGEPLIMRYFLLSSGIRSLRVEGIEKSPEVKGFIVKHIDEDLEDKIVKIDGNEYIKSHFYTYILTPAETGEFSIGNASIIIEIDFSNINSFFSRSNKKRVLFENKKIYISPLPSKNIPANYRGDIGNFKIKTENFNSAAQIYEEKKFKVIIEGKGNFLTMAKPSFVKQNENLKIIIDEKEADINLQGNEIHGKKEYDFTIIPETNGKINLDKIQFTFFNTTTNSFKTIESRPLSLDISGELNNDNKIEFNTKNKESVDFNPVLIFLIIGIITTGIISLLLWEKNRFKIVQNNTDNNKIEKKNNLPEENQNDLLKKCKSSFFKGDQTEFIKNMNSFLILKKESLSEKTDRLVIEDIDNMKDKLYSFKFGGVEPTMEILEKLFEEIKKI